MEYHLRPRDDPWAGDAKFYAFIHIYNTVLCGGGYTFEWQFKKNKVLLNRHIASPGPELMACGEYHKRAGVYLHLGPCVDLTGRQYLIIYKAENPGNQSQAYQVYHNHYMAEKVAIAPGDDSFAITVDCNGNNATYMYFNLANQADSLFKEIAIYII